MIQDSRQQGMGSAIPSGVEMFSEWLAHEGSKSWDALDTSPDGSYEKVWQAWLQHLQAPENQSTASPLSTPQSKNWHEADATDIQRFLKVRDGQKAYHHPERKISEVTRRRYWRLLERIYDHALEHGWVQSNPATGLEPGERPPSEDGKGHCLPPLLWRALLWHFPLADGYQNARDRAIVLLLYETALAPEEVRALLWKDLQIESVQREEQDYALESNDPQPSSLPRFLHIDGGRAAQQRLIELPPSVAQALLDWRRFSAAQRGPSVVDANHAVFYSRRGGPLSVRMLFHVASQIIQRAHQAQPESAQKMPLQRVGPQVLRNTAIVQWLRSGMAESEVIARVGLNSTRALRHLQHYL